MNLEETINHLLIKGVDQESISLVKESIDLAVSIELRIEDLDRITRGFIVNKNASENASDFESEYSRLRKERSIFKTKVRTLAKLTGGIEQNKSDIMDYLIDHIEYNINIKGSYANFDGYPKNSLKLEKIFDELPEERRKIVQEFIVFMYEQKYKIPERIFFGGDEGGSTYEDSLTALEVFMCYLDSFDRTIVHNEDLSVDRLSKLVYSRTLIPSNKSKNGLFNTLIKNKEGFRQKRITDITRLVSYYVPTLEIEYPNRVEALECLEAGFNRINHAFIWGGEYRHKGSDESTEYLSSISNLLKEEPKHRGFYKFLVGMLKDHDVSISSNIKVLEKIARTLDFDLEYKDLKRAIGYNKTLTQRCLEVLSYGESRSIEEVVECSKLGIPGYIAIKKIGEGGTRNVYKTINEQRNHVLVIKVNKDLADITKERAKSVIIAKKSDISSNENMALMNLTHDNIARMWDFGKIDNKNYVVEEYVDGMNLENVISSTGPLNIEEFARIFNSVLSAVRHIASKGYVHRDIKPDNILISQDFKTVKLTDLQTAVKVNEEGIHLGESYGSLRTMAPELINENKASFASDMYSLGVCMYYALTGEMPKYAPDSNDTIDIARQKLRRFYDVDETQITETRTKNDIIADRYESIMKDIQGALNKRYIIENPTTREEKCKNVYLGVNINDLATTIGSLMRYDPGDRLDIDRMKKMIESLERLLDPKIIELHIAQFSGYHTD